MAEAPTKTGTGTTRMVGETRPQSREVDGVFRLHATDLLLKGGFGDGDILDDLIHDMGLGDVPDREVEDDGFDAEESFDHAAVELLVTRHLVPVLPVLVDGPGGEAIRLADLVAGRCSKSHNPIRLCVLPRPSDEVLAAALDGVVVDVPEAAAREMLRELAAEFPAG